AVQASDHAGVLVEDDRPRNAVAVQRFLERVERQLAAGCVRRKVRNRDRQQREEHDERGREAERRRRRLHRHAPAPERVEERLHRLTLDTARRADRRRISRTPKPANSMPAPSMRMTLDAACVAGSRSSGAMAAAGADTSPCTAPGADAGFTAWPAENDPLSVGLVAGTGATAAAGGAAATNPGGRKMPGSCRSGPHVTGNGVRATSLPDT